MKKALLCITVLAVFCSCGKKTVRNTVPKIFITEVRLKTTPVKDQGTSSLCWVYSMLATFETEHLMQGDSVNLSPDYVARMFLSEQAYENAISKRQGKPFPDGDITTRGVAAMVPRLIYTYGLQHYDAYHRSGNCNYNVLARRLQLLTETSGKMNRIGEAFDNIMDDVIAPLPLKVYMLGAEYTPIEFAHSVCRDNEYIPLTSFTHHPFNSRFVLEIPDNRYHDTFLNVPLDTMMAYVERSLRSGHPVCWEGDTSEKGFDFSDGMAHLRNEKDLVSQEHRQYSFETGRTTDDHCMEIVGIAHDKEGRKYFICKNSWGTDNPYGGFMYLSENYVRLKTIAVLVNEEVLS